MYSIVLFINIFLFSFADLDLFTNEKAVSAKASRMTADIKLSKEEKVSRFDAPRSGARVAGSGRD